MRKRGVAGLALAASALCGVPAQAQSDAVFTVEAGIGRSFLRLPDTAFTLRSLWEAGSNANTATETKYIDHDGSFDNGERVDVGVFGPPGAYLGIPISFGVTGFYSRFEGRSAANCEAPNDVASCGFSLLINDPAIIELPSDDAGSLATTTRRNVKHWGAALEARSTQGLLGLPLHARGGLAMRAIEQQTSIDGVLTGDHTGGNRSIRYDEGLNTRYYGAFLGLIGRVSMATGLSLILDGDIGLYYADTAYRGRTTVDPNTPAIGSGLATAPNQALSLSSDKTSLIAKMKAEVEQDFGTVRLAVFALAEWYSYAPVMRYNDADVGVAGGFDFTAVGINTKTQIASDDAWSMTYGGRLSIPFK